MPRLRRTRSSSENSTRKQIRESHKRFPAGRCTGQSPVKSYIQHERLSRRVTHCPKIPHGLAAKEGLGKMPDFAWHRKLSTERMGNGKRLAKLRPANRFLDQFSEHCVCVVA